MSRMYLLVPLRRLPTRRLKVYLPMHLTFSSVDTAFELGYVNKILGNTCCLVGSLHTSHDTIYFLYEIMHLPLNVITKKTGNTGYTSLQKISFLWRVTFINKFFTKLIWSHTYDRSSMSCQCGRSAVKVTWPCVQSPLCTVRTLAHCQQILLPV